MFSKLGVRLVVAGVLLIGTVGCGGNPLAPQPTATSTRTPRPTFTPLVQATSTFVPLPTALPTLAPLGPTTAPTKAAPVRTATRTPTKKPPTPKPATSAPVPPTAVPATVPPAPVVSAMEFHVNPPRCEHSGKTFIKGTVYLDKNDPSQRYVQAIVALGPSDASTVWEKTLTDGMGEYTFILSDTGSRPGTWHVWLVTPSMVRKSDVGGPIVTNNLGPDSPSACWAGSVDFWK